MRGVPPARARGHGGYEWMAEAAIASVTVASGVGMTRLFVGTSFLRDSLAMGLASHLVAAATRRARLSTLVAAPLSGLCLVTAVTVLRYRDTGWLVLPTTETIEAARAHLTEGWSVASGSPSPVEAVPGLVLVTGVALWVAAFMADTTAFRAHSSVSALAPGAGFFAFTAVAGVGDGRVRHAGPVLCDCSRGSAGAAAARSAAGGVDRGEAGAGRPSHGPRRCRSRLGGRVRRRHSRADAAWSPSESLGRCRGP